MLTHLSRERSQLPAVSRRTELKLVLLVVGRYGIPASRASRHLRGTRKIDWTEVMHVASILFLHKQRVTVINCARLDVLAYSCLFGL